MNPHKSNGVIIFALVGLLIAGGAFLAIMFTSPRAKTENKYENLRIPVPSIPARASVKAINRPSSTPTALPLASPLISPLTSTTPSATISSTPQP